MKGSVLICKVAALAASIGKDTRASTTAMVSVGTIRVPNRNRERKDIFAPTVKLIVQSVLRQRSDESERSLDG